MKIKAGLEAEYEEYKQKFTKDPYHARIVTYGAEWADLMEARLANGEFVRDIAQSTSSQADYDGITGFMYGSAVSALCHFWEHGEQLLFWHNKDMAGEEGNQATDLDRAINPAIVTIGSGPVTTSFGTTLDEVFGK